MSEPTSAHTVLPPAWLRRVPAAAAMATGAIAALALTGWLLGVPPLRGVIPGFVPMNPLTAAAFLLAAVALWLLREGDVKRAPVGRAAGVAVAAIGALILARYLFDAPVALDRLLFRAQLDALRPPNRMAPNTALGFLFSGLALALLDARALRRVRPAAICILPVVLLAFVTLLGYAYGAAGFYRVATFIPMALNTAVAFLLLSAGVVAARPLGGAPGAVLSDTPSGAAARRLLLPAVLLPSVLGWLTLAGIQREAVTLPFGASLLAVATVVLLSLLIAWNAVVTRRAATAVHDAERRVSRFLEQDLWHRVVDTDPSLIFVKDWDGRFIIANQAVADIYGTSVERLLGKADADFNPNSDEVEAFVEDDRAVMHTGSRKLIPEEPVTNPETGETRWFQTIKVPLTLPGEERSLVLGVATEITERKRLEEQFRQAQKMEAVGRLAGGIAHDFNNVLTAILGYAGLLLDTLDAADDRRADLEEIRRAAERAAALTRQLLAFSRKQVLQPRVVNLNTIVTNTEKMLGRLIGEDVELRAVLADDLEPVRADPGQLEQVLMNLAVNARDAMPQGGRLTIETANVELGELYAARRVQVTPGRYVMLAVSDTGVGMDEDTKARLFEPFFTTKAAGKGTGLGLATVYGIVKQSGGYVWVYSEPGKGTTFKVYLPRVTEAETVMEPVAARAVLGGHESILLVEDEPGVRHLARRVLERYGYRVEEAAEGEDAARVSADRSTPFDLLVTDVVLPECSGRELAERLGPRVRRVLYMSGYTDDAIVHHGVLAPGVAFVQKPFTPEALARKVREVLDAPAAEAR